MIETPLRIAVAVPVSLVTWPITLPAPALPSAWAIFDVAGQRVDDVAGEMGAVGRRQRGALLALEVILHDQFVVVPGQDQVDAGPLEVAVEQQIRVRDDDGVRRRVRGCDRIDMVMAHRDAHPNRQRAAWHRICRRNSIGHREMVNIYIIFNSLSLHIIGACSCETISLLVSTIFGWHRRRDIRRCRILKRQGIQRMLNQSISTSLDATSRSVNVFPSKKPHADTCMIFPLRFPAGYCANCSAKTVILDNKSNHSGRISHIRRKLPQVTINRTSFRTRERICPSGRRCVKFSAKWRDGFQPVSRFPARRGRL